MKEFWRWREVEHDFVDLSGKQEKSKFNSLKREILKLYPHLGQTLDKFEATMGTQTYEFKKASLPLHADIMLKQSPNMPLVTKINLSFFCPDHEFKAKLCQLVYEQLQPVFNFTEDKMKLHSFIKAASWRIPIALLAVN